MLSGAAVGRAEDWGCEHCRLEALRALGPEMGATDGVSGKDLRNFPPHRVADMTEMKLDFTIPDMETPRIEARQSLTFRTFGKAVPEMRLDARQFGVSRVMISRAGDGVRERRVSFTHDGVVLTVRFDPPLGGNANYTMLTEYTIGRPADGLVWTLPSRDHPGRPAQLHTQGQPQTNSFWFPIVDFPNDRLRTEISVTVPPGYTAISNGRLLSRKTLTLERSNKLGERAPEAFEQFVYRQAQDHVPYLVSLIVGKFDVVDLGTPELPMPVYVPPGRAADVRGTYGRTPDMVRFFETLLQEPYPFEKYAQTLVWNFGAGGMENSSATTMYDTALFSPEALLDHDLDGLISHELAHQWFGDLITCNSWQHIWLNEGWATYMTALWFEHRDGATGYLDSMLANFGRVIGADRVDPAKPTPPGMASRIYTNPWDAFGRAANPYPKGASVLHMLRRKLGDEVFFRGVHEYLDRFKGRTVETSDFRRALEEASGLSLEKFFVQWVERPGVPRVDVDLSFEGGTLRVKATQTQHIDGNVPAFSLDVPISVTLADGSVRREVLSFAAREGSLEIPLPGAPAMVAIDPDMTLLAEWTIRPGAGLPANATAAQVAAGPTDYSRVQAMRTLGQSPQLAGAEAIEKLVRDEKAPTVLRVEGVRALAARGDLATFSTLFTSVRDRWEVREALVEGAAALATDERRPLEARAAAQNQFEGLIAAMIDKDPSRKVRADALAALGKMKSVRFAPVVVAALEQPSQDDRVRQAAIDALVAMDRPEALSAAVRYSAPAYLSRTRATAIRALAQAARFDRDRAFRTLEGLLRDSVRRPRLAAGEAIAQLGDTRGREALAALEQETTDPVEKRLIAGWRAALEKRIEDLAAQGLSEPETVWRPILGLAPFTQSEADRENLSRDPAAFFASLGYVVEMRGEQAFMLLHNTRGKRLAATDGRWSVTRAYRDDADPTAIGFELDPTGANLLAELTGKSLEKPLAIEVGGVVYIAPRVRSPIAGSAVISGSFTEAQASALIEQLSGKAGLLEFRIAVAPGERSDEAALREAFRSAKPNDKP
ncbi:MAG: M1 family aminopeptidase [Planctomycetota bacterium]|nr:M1 family aminopeptidase [Planctomycetota bacterium]